MTFVMKYHVKEENWESIMIHDAQGEEQGPAGIACNPRDARIKGSTRSNRCKFPAPTDD